ncbi:hypothetical protein Q9L58_000369 [Maublancomyces gigas]|uniref:Uncharacterized protein n=1 Tax=Discina gigas TaxID=1032678 RepID=A0ABR3GWW4_9PEZI
MAWFNRGNQPSRSQPSANSTKLEKISESFTSIQNVTAPVLRLGRVDQTLNLCEALIADKSLDTAQRRSIQITTSKTAKLAISILINHYGIFEKKWYLQQYFQRCLEADEAIYTPGGLLKASPTTDLRSAAAAWEIVEQFHNSWVETRAAKWDIWLERAIGGSSLRQFSMFQKSRHSIYCAIASKLHHEALRASDAIDFMRALSLLAEGESSFRMALELEEALNNNRAPTDVVYTEAEDIASSYEILRSTCTATRALKAGHLRFSAALLEQAEKLMDNSLLALDDYRLALSCATNKDIELEAEAVFYLGKTHHILLKSELKAHELYIRAISLVTALSPKLPGGTWFTEAKVAIETRRAKLRAQEDSEWYKRRQPIYEKMKDAIDEIHKKSSLDARPLVTWIMATHPPKTEGTLPDLEKPKSECSDNRLVLEAVRRYHPDKNSSFGDEWHVLSEEITKALNNCFGRLKGETS